jgi:hypothetical protein
MASIKLNDWIQIIAIFALVCSLIFVGLQMRQTQAIAISAAYQARASQTTELIMEIAGNQNALAAFGKAVSGDLDSITSAEEMAGQYVVYGVMFNWENVHFQYTNGFVSDERWIGTRNDIKGALRSPFWIEWVHSASDRMRPAFRKVLTEVEDELNAEGSN